MFIHCLYIIFSWIVQSVFPERTLVLLRVKRWSHMPFSCCSHPRCREVQLPSPSHPIPIPLFSLSLGPPGCGLCSTAQRLPGVFSSQQLSIHIPSVPDAWFQFSARFPLIAFICSGPRRKPFNVPWERWLKSIALVEDCGHFLGSPEPAQRPATPTAVFLKIWCTRGIR